MSDEEMYMELCHTKDGLRSLEKLAEAVVEIWRRQRDGEFSSDEEILQKLETPIEALERAWFTDIDEPRGRT